MTIQATDDTHSVQLDALAIQKILPHRYPFLLVDKIIELEPLKRVVGIKNVTRRAARGPEPVAALWRQQPVFHRPDARCSDGRLC